MGEIVPSSRYVCEAKCILYFDGCDVQGIIENISLSGALIMLNSKIPNSIDPGDKCDMVFCSNPDLFPVKYTCKVVRIDSKIIGIEFLELNIM
jgi:c-di-GMP-binding flagellar brake protein YcgR